MRGCRVQQAEEKHRNDTDVGPIKGVRHAGTKRPWLPDSLTCPGVSAGDRGSGLGFVPPGRKGQPVSPVQAVGE